MQELPLEFTTEKCYNGSVDSMATRGSERKNETTWNIPSDPMQEIQRILRSTPTDSPVIGLFLAYLRNRFGEVMTTPPAVPQGTDAIKY